MWRLEAVFGGTSACRGWAALAWAPRWWLVAHHSLTSATAYGSALYAFLAEDRKMIGTMVNQVGIKRPLAVAKHQVAADGKAGPDA